MRQKKVVRRKNKQTKTNACFKHMGLANTWDSSKSRNARSVGPTAAACRPFGGQRPKLEQDHLARGIPSSSKVSEHVQAIQARARCPSSSKGIQARAEIIMPLGAATLGRDDCVCSQACIGGDHASRLWDSVRKGGWYGWKPSSSSNL